MLTVNEIIKQKLDGKTKGVESVFLKSFFDDILESTHDGTTKGYTYFDAFKSKSEFEFFVKVVENIIETNYTVKNIVTDIDVKADDFELEVNFDLKKENDL